VGAVPVGRHSEPSANVQRVKRDDAQWRQWQASGGTALSKTITSHHWTSNDQESPLRIYGGDLVGESVAARSFSVQSPHSVGCLRAYAFR